MAHTACLLLGTNLGDRSNNLERAKALLESEAGVISNASAIYETAAWGVSDQPAFWNQVLVIETGLLPAALLQKIHEIESALGRERRERWTARTLDIDILYFDTEVLQSPTLVIPHPQIPFRRFTLVPLAEILPDYVHPVLQKTNADLLVACPDGLSVVRVG